MRTLALIPGAVILALLAQPAAPYRITHTYTLGGDGSWDYIVPDPPDHRLFIARQNRVMVVDENEGALRGEVTGINGAHGTAVVPATGHGFATSGRDQSVVMFDLKTLQTLGRIAAAEDADAIIYDPASDRVFTFNGDAHSSTVIDPHAGRLVTNIDLGGKPEYGASAGDGKIYANLTDTSDSDRHSPGHGRRVPRHPDTADRAGGAQYGARPDHASPLSRVGEIRTGSGRRARARAGAARLLHADGGRARRAVKPIFTLDQHLEDLDERSLLIGREPRQRMRRDRHSFQQPRAHSRALRRQLNHLDPPVPG
jgi:hypothetical protein